jgi:hypothetical protein
MFDGSFRTGQRGAPVRNGVGGGKATTSIIRVMKLAKAVQVLLSSSSLAPQLTKAAFITSSTRMTSRAALPAPAFRLNRSPVSCGATLFMSSSTDSSSSGSSTPTSSMKGKLLVLGGTGYLGQTICQIALQVRTQCFLWQSHFLQKSSSIGTSTHSAPRGLIGRIRARECQP